MPNDDEDLPKPSGDEKTTSAPYQLSEPEVHFAFGPDNLYWFRCGTQWRFLRLNNGEWSVYEIENPYWVAFKHDTGVLIGGVNADGESQVTNTFIQGYLIKAKDVDSYVRSREAYRELETWINEHVKSDPEKLKRITISIGPRGSYFARSESSHTTHALPKDLQTAIDDSKSPPSAVALGARGSWVVLWADGSRSWDLRDAYPRLATSGYLESDKSKVTFIALNTYIEDNFFVVLEDGSCCYSATLSNQTELKQLDKMIDSYTLSHAKRDGSSFTATKILDGVPKTYKITPDSSGQETRGEALMSMLRNRQNINIHPTGDLAFLCAVSGSAGILAKAAGLPRLRAAGVVASTSIGAALALYRGS